jgi:predicted lactoylglutathione lyase
MRMIFVNLPVKDLKASKEFFTELDFEFNPDFSDDQAACMVVDENIFVMLLVEERFKDFINREIADATSATEAITCLSVDSKESVDEWSRRPSRPGGAVAGSRP